MLSGIFTREPFAAGKPAKKKMSGWRRAVFSAASICIVFLSSSGWADEKYPYLDEVRIDNGIVEKMEQRVDEAINGVSGGKAIIDRGFLLEGLMSNQWIITRSVVNGFGDIDSVIGTLEGDRFKKAAVVDEILSRIKIMNDNRVTSGMSALTPAEIKQEIESFDISTLGTVPALTAQQSFVDELKTLKSNGFFGTGGTIFNKTKMLAFFLLSISLMARLAFMAYESIIKQSQPPLAWFRVFFRFAILLLILMFMKNMIMFGISMSDGVRNMVSSAAFGDVNSAGDVVGKLLRAKIDYLNIDPGASLLELFTSTASALLAKFFSWLSYFIAAAVLFVIVLLGDIMMSLTAVVGPLLCALSLMPTFEANFGHWFKGYITLLFYGPLAAVYAVMLVAIMTIGLDTSALAFIIISIAYIVGATNVPNMAKSLSGTVLAGLAIGIASMPMKFATGALGSAAGGGLKAGAGAFKNMMSQ